MQGGHHAKGSRKALATIVIMAIVALQLLAVADKVAAATAISYVGAVSGTASSGTSTTFAPPAGLQTGDMLFVAIGTGGLTITPADTGWNTLEVATQQFVNDLFAYRIVAASDPSTYTFNFNGAGSNSRAMWAYRNVDPANPIQTASFATNSVGYTQSTPAVSVNGSTS